MTEKNSIGWQKQPSKLNIQGEIERAIEEVTGEKVDLIASGRTDAGVHALGQVANFRLEKRFSNRKNTICIKFKTKKIY